MADVMEDRPRDRISNGETATISRRRLVQIGAGSGLLGCGAMLTLGGVWAHDMTTDRLSLLGSGNELSLFLTAGQARCLIAAGNLPDDFTDALGQCRFPTTRRIDLLLLMPSALTGVGDQAISIASGRHTARVGSMNLTATTAHFGSIPILPSPRRVQLPSGITLNIESAELPNTQKQGPVWRILIHRGDSRIAIVSGHDAISAFRSVGQVSLAICPADAVAETLAAFRPRALIFGTGRTKPPLAAAAYGQGWQAPYQFMIPAGRTMEIAWRPGGLRLSGQSPLPVSGSPSAATASAPHPSRRTPV